MNLDLDFVEKRIQSDELMPFDAKLPVQHRTSGWGGPLESDAFQSTRNDIGNVFVSHAFFSLSLGA